MEVLAEPVWRERAEEHACRVDAWTSGYRARRSRGESHPVEDFLFTYYSYRPAQLRRWHPGAGVVLAGDPPHAGWPGYARSADGVSLSAAEVGRRRAAAQGVRRLLAATASRPTQLGCLGLHEWAMVHRQPAGEVRHGSWPLRLGVAGTDAVVESHKLRCTHFDAFRFFTPAATPLNAVWLTREMQAAYEQPGCLHAAMDLYKWAYKLSPLLASELVADCFALAREVRSLDMRASPYDLSALGYEPVRIETPEGKAQYVAEQRGFAERAARLRTRLLDAIR